MNESDALALIRQSHSLIFSTREFSMIGNIRISFASQMLRRLSIKGHIIRLYRGLYADHHHPEFNIYRVTPFLTRPHPAAVSLLTALHLHGMIEQIPQLVDVVSTAPSRNIKTPVASYAIHQVRPNFFLGYEYYQKTGEFLMATPEKALVDCAYFAVRKGRRFSTLPELSFPKVFSQRKLFHWVHKITYPKLRKGVETQLAKWL